MMRMRGPGYEQRDENDGANDRDGGSAHYQCKSTQASGAEDYYRTGGPHGPRRMMRGAAGASLASVCEPYMLASAKVGRAPHERT
jgi:hypothetical protein